jgi:hypothetical protein
MSMVMTVALVSIDLVVVCTDLLKVHTDLVEVCTDPEAQAELHALDLLSHAGNHLVLLLQHSSHLHTTID